MSMVRIWTRTEKCPLTWGFSPYTDSHRDRLYLVPLGTGGVRRPVLVPSTRASGRLSGLPSGLEGDIRRGNSTANETCDHHWVRIGPYLKCSRCGDIKAAPTEEDQ